MTNYIGIVLQGEAAMIEDSRRDAVINSAVMAALNVIDDEYPEFKKSAGPFGDKLAGKLHNEIQQAFYMLDAEQTAEFQEYERLKKKFEGK